MLQNLTVKNTVTILEWSRASLRLHLDNLFLKDCFPYYPLVSFSFKIKDTFLSFELHIQPTITLM